MYQLYSNCNSNFAFSYSVKLTFVVEEEKQIQSFMADLLLWLSIIDVPEPLKYTVFRLQDTLVSFSKLQFAVVGNVVDRPQ